MARDMCRKMNLGWTVDPDFDPSSGLSTFFIFCFCFFAVLVPGCFRVMFFIFVSVLWSSRSVGALRWGVW